jgi:hypothetical protein
LQQPSKGKEKSILSLHKCVNSLNFTRPFANRKLLDLTKQEMEVIQKIIEKLCAWYLFVECNYKHKGATKINKRCEGQRYLHSF